MKTSTSIRFFLLGPANLLAGVLAWLGWRSLDTNVLGWFLLLFGAAYIIGSVIFFLPRNAPLISRSEGAVWEESGDRSFWLIIPGFVVTFFMSPLEYLYLGGAARAGVLLQAIGLALLLLAVALRVWVRRALKAQYTGHVQVIEGRPLQTGGPYRYVRHPGYTAFLLMGLGLAVGFGSFIGIGAVFLLILPSLCYRMRVEETLLARQYGEEYLRYASRTKRLLPGLW